MRVTSKFEDYDPTQTFPVSDSLTAFDCFDKGKYKMLFPDSRYTSMAWLEVGPEQWNLTGPKNTLADGKTAVKIVVWLNLQKLGIGTDITTYALDMLSRISGTHRFTIGGNDNNTAQILGASIYYDFSQVFTGYSFDQKEAAFFYPYSFFSINAECKMTISMGCLAAIQTAEPINCITEW